MEAERRIHFAVLAVAIVVAILLRLHGLLALPLVEDALYTLRDAREFRWQDFGLNRPLYFAIQNLVLEAVDPSPLALRLPAFLFGVGGVLATAWVALRIFGPLAAATATVLLAVAPWHLYISQIGRYYSLIFLLAVLLYWALYVAQRDSDIRTYLAALVLTIVGVLTHFTFAFALPGLFLLEFVDKTDTRVRIRLPSSRSLLAYWLPASLFCGAVVVDIAGLAEGQATISTSIDFVRQALLLPAIAQWLSPALVIAAAVAVLYCSMAPEIRVSRWGMMALTGSISGVVLLLAASTFRAVYADYATAILPFVFLSVGAALELWRRWWPDLSLVQPYLLLAIIVGAVSPGTVSHLIDGTRFDFRSAFAKIEEQGPTLTVTGPPLDVQMYYARHLSHSPYNGGTGQLYRLAEIEGQFWFVAQVRRYGVVGDEDGSVREWLDRYCRVILRTEGRRFDYRMYRIELHRCGRT